jgi:hypothetical protein
LAALHVAPQRDRSALVEETTMHASTRLIAAAVAASALASFGSAFAQAQEISDGSDYHPLQMNSPVSAEVNAGAIAAAHANGTESIGQSTAAPLLVSTTSSAEVYAGAVAAAHSAGTELPGQSTSPVPPLGSTH